MRKLAKNIFSKQTFRKGALSNLLSFNSRPFSSIQTPPKPLGTGIPTNMGLDHIGLVVPNVQQAVDFLMEVFDAEKDWEMIRGPTPTAGERGWGFLGVHPDSYMPHVVQIKCGDQPMTQYIELFEWVSPDQKKPDGPWWKFSDIGHSYISFTCKDIWAVTEHIKKNVIPKYPTVRFLMEPMSFPLKGEVNTSCFITSPWGQLIELTCWSKSKDKADVIKKQQIPKIHPSVGQPIKSLPTPSFMVDLDVLDHNIALMKTRFKEKNVEWRIPCKAHKCPELTKYILEKGGASGVVLLTLSECESFADHGIQDIYLANQVASKEEIRRLSLLAKKIKRFRVAVDNMEYLEAISDAVKTWEVTTPIEVLVELNVGHNRCGVTIDEAIEMTLRVKELEKTKGSVIFAGITGYEGHTPVLPPAEKTKETLRCHQMLAEAKRRIEEKGVKVDLISAGSSCNYMDCLKAGIINEVQAGGGTICDILYCEKANLQDHGHKMGALILTSVISMPADKTRALGNAGFKAVGWHPFGGLPRSRDYPDLNIIGLSAEHTKFESKKGKNEKINEIIRGDKVVLIPGYTDAMGFLHRQVYGIRKDVVESVWKTVSDKTWE